MLKIGDFSKLSRVSIRMLRYYDEMGLLKPVSIDDFTGYRYYSVEQLPVVGRINALKDMGFSLAVIQEMIISYNDKDTISKFLNIKKAELINENNEVNYKLKLIETAFDRLREDDNMNYDVIIKSLPERYVASVHMIIPSYDKEGILWEILNKETSKYNIKPTDPTICSVVFYDDEYKEADVEAEAQKTLTGRYNDTEHVRFKTEPAVTFASATYKGSYEMIGDVHLAVAKWVEANGYEYAGHTFNIYHANPGNTSNPNDYITEICYPVKKI